MPNTPVFRFAVTEGFGDEFIPTQGSALAAGWDVRAAEEVEILNGRYAKIPLGIRCFAPDGWWLELRPRSSTFAKKHLHALYGVVDSDYEGQIFFACQFNSPLPNTMKTIIEKGDRIGQLVPFRRQYMHVQSVSNEEFDALCKSRGQSRGSGGFGSTGA